MGIPEKDKIYTYEESLTWGDDVPHELINGIFYDWNGKPVSWQSAGVFYTNKDLDEWKKKNRWELIYGVAYAMASPSANHQMIVLEMAGQFRSYLKGKKCRLLLSPFDVKFKMENEEDIRVQPDLFVVCDTSRINKNHYQGAPDLIIEVLSPSTGKKDKTEKFQLYQRFGVKEYWIADPVHKTIDVFTLEDGKYGAPRTYGDADTIKVHVLEDCHVTLADVFEGITEED
ncbi:MAG: Uma2 family endonuclease [Defluviitaleaceae bacterium]|nr:Uma2 family endonuclease [Defluviitaleaceae bacterium]